MTTTELVAHAGFIIALIALGFGIGAYRHSRTNRRVIMKILQRRLNEARQILLQETEEEHQRFMPP